MVEFPRLKTIRTGQKTETCSNENITVRNGGARDVGVSGRIYAGTPGIARKSELYHALNIERSGIHFADTVLAGLKIALYELCKNTCAVVAV